MLEECGWRSKIGMKLSGVHGSVGQCDGQNRRREKGNESWEHKKADYTVCVCFANWVMPLRAYCGRMEWGVQVFAAPLNITCNLAPHDLHVSTQQPKLTQAAIGSAEPSTPWCMYSCEVLDVARLHGRLCAI